jgi:methionyl-tRNA formyltransferase
MTRSRSLVFLGSKAAGLGACRLLTEGLPAGTIAAIVCPDDRTDPRNVSADFEALAAERQIPFHVAATRRETMALLERLAPETVIVHGWYQILPVDELPDLSFLGFHYSPLPRYRGGAPLVWQIIRGEPEIGISFFELTPEMDAGRLVDQKSAPLGPDDTIADALEKANALALDMLREFVPGWLDGSVALQAQPDREPSYCGQRVPEDGWIDWSWSAAGIHDFIRAQTRPYPGAFTSLPDGRRLTVWRSQREERQFMGTPGAVVEIAPDHVVVAAGEGALRLIRVQAEGEDEAAASKVLRSIRTRLGGAARP